MRVEVLTTAGRKEKLPMTIELGLRSNTPGVLLCTPAGA